MDTPKTPAPMAAMREKLLWCAVGALGAACVGQGCYIYTQHEKRRRPAVEDFWKEQDEWISETRKNMLGGGPIPFRKFDELFDDDFFGRRFDPFSEVESFHKRFSPLFPNDERSLLGRSWRDWFQDRMGVADIRPEIKTTDDQVILSLKIPGLAGESLNIDVNADRIRIAYDAKTLQEKKDEGGGSYFKSRSVRHFEKIMPIPDGADPEKSRVLQEGDTVKIIFEKVRDQAGKAKA